MSIMKFSGLALLIGVFCLTVEVATPKKLNAEIDALLNELKELAHKLSYDINDDKTKTYLETHTDDYGIIQTDAGKPISAIAVFQVSKIFLKNGFDVYDDGQINPANYDEALHEYDKTILGKNYTSWIDGRNKRNIFASKKTTNYIMGYIFLGFACCFWFFIIFALPTMFLCCKDRMPK